MIGIYKITIPEGKIYIGQSGDIKIRFYSHKTSKITNQKKLANSFMKYGAENHTFEVLEECSFSDLNKRERYYQDLYDACGDNGLNAMLTNFIEGFISDRVKRVTVTFRLPKETIKKLEELAKKEKRSMTSMLEILIDKEYEKNKYII